MEQVKLFPWTRLCGWAY